MVELVVVFLVGVVVGLLALAARRRVGEALPDEVAAIRSAGREARRAIDHASDAYLNALYKQSRR